MKHEVGARYPWAKMEVGDYFDVSIYRRIGLKNSASGNGRRNSRAYRCVPLPCGLLVRCIRVW